MFEPVSGAFATAHNLPELETLPSGKPEPSPAAAASELNRLFLKFVATGSRDPVLTDRFAVSLAFLMQLIMDVPRTPVREDVERWCSSVRNLLRALKTDLGSDKKVAELQVAIEDADTAVSLAAKWTGVHENVPASVMLSVIGMPEDLEALHTRLQAFQTAWASEHGFTLCPGTGKSGINGCTEGEAFDLSTQQLPMPELTAPPSLGRLRAGLDSLMGILGQLRDCKIKLEPAIVRDPLGAISDINEFNTSGLPGMLAGMLSYVRQGLSDQPGSVRLALEAPIARVEGELQAIRMSPASGPQPDMVAFYSIIRMPHGRKREVVEAYVQGFTRVIDKFFREMGEKYGFEIHELPRLPSLVAVPK